MAGSKIRLWGSETSASENATAAALNFAEGQLPSTVNNNIRTLMGQIKDTYAWGEHSWVEGSLTVSVASQTTFKQTSDQTSFFMQGRRVRLRGGTATVFATVLSASFTTETTVTIEDATGSLSASMSVVGLSMSVTAAPRRADKLEISGTLSVGTAVVVPDGTAAAPSIQVGDANSGIYGTSATTSPTRQVGVAVNGNKVAGFSWDQTNATGQLLLGSASPVATTPADTGILSIRDSVGNLAPICVISSGLQPIIAINHQAEAADFPFLSVITTATSSTAFSFFSARSRGADIEFNLRGDGTGLCDGSWTGGGADFAEMREWADGNASATDRAGMAVVLTDDGKIRCAKDGEEPIGVVSANPTVIGGNRLQWPGKYLTDDYGREIKGALNPAWRENEKYLTRDLRPEWAAVGLLGFVPVRNDQVTSPRWVKSRRVSDQVTEWLVR